MLYKFMSGFWKKFNKWFFELKVSLSLLTIANSIMLVYSVIKLSELPSKWLMPVIVSVGFVALILAGRILDRRGTLQQRQIREGERRSPMHVEHWGEQLDSHKKILERLDRLEEKIG